MDRIDWICGEWHGRKDNKRLANFLSQTHLFRIHPNYQETRDMFMAQRI
jgi:hypothetical protein